MEIETKNQHTQHHEAPRAFSPQSWNHGTPKAARTSQRRILCVDDEPLGTRLRGEVLEEHGYSVTIYNLPLDVLRCDFSNFDIAILDFQMPELNGRDLLLRMRALGVRFPIVLLTGCVDALSYEDRVLFARCIDKAEPITSLLDTIAEFLDPNQTPDFDTGGRAV